MTRKDINNPTRNQGALEKNLVRLLSPGKKQFDFVAAISRGQTLLVGEGNLSFTRSLVKKNRINPGRLTATTHEAVKNLMDGSKVNAAHLERLGVNVMHGVNATELSRAVPNKRFDNIVFQFPHTCNRIPILGRNPNFVLVRDFLKNAMSRLAIGGAVYITAVESPHYRGAFQFEEAAKIARFSKINTYPFDPETFPDYSHTMTNNSISGINNHHAFSTWVFQR